MTDATAGGAIRFTHAPGDSAAATVSVVLDTTWTAPPEPVTGSGPVRVSVRDVAEQILAAHDLIAETSVGLDRWAAASGVIERLTIRDTSFWFYVRLRTWTWLQERILWAGIVESLVREHGPARIVAAPGTDPALLDVLRLVAARDGLPLDEEPAPEPATAQAAGPARPTAASAKHPTGRAPRGARPSRLRRSPLMGLARTLRNRVFGPPPPSPQVVRQLELKARLERVRAHVDALAGEPESRLLVVHEHARQRVDTATGPRSMNPYLDPIVDRLRGTTLEPIVLDIRARAGQDAAWERIGSGADPRLLPADALAPPEPPAPTAPGEPSDRPKDPGAPPVASARPAASAPPVPAAPPVVDPVIAAWRDQLDCPIEAFGIDLGPLLAAEVAATASRFLPGMTASIDRIEAFLKRIRPAGIVLADEYHRQDWMTAARSAGIPVAAVQHGMIYRHHNGYIHAARPASLRLPQRTFVFGRWERDLLRTSSVYGPDEVVVGGSPRLDLVQPAYESAELRRELGVADDERLVVVSGTWGGIYRRFHYPIALAALVDRPLPGVHIIVKLHPGEPDEGPYRATIEAAAAARGVAPPRITIVQSIDLYRLLAAADAHLGIHSTVLTEAVVTRTPNLLAAGLAGADLLGYVEAGVAVPVHDGGDLLAALAGAASVGALDEAAAVAFADAHFEPGSASERIAADLTAWLT